MAFGNFKRQPPLGSGQKASSNDRSHDDGIDHDLAEGDEAPATTSASEPLRMEPWYLESPNETRWRMTSSGDHDGCGDGRGRRRPDNREGGSGVNGHGAHDAPGEAVTDTPADEYQRIKTELDCADPWLIVKVTATYDSPMLGPNRFDIWIHQTQGFWECPLCHQQVPGRGETSTRVFRSIKRDPETYVFVRIPILECPVHGARHVLVPWAQKTHKWRHVRDLDDGPGSGPSRTS